MRVSTGGRGGRVFRFRAASLIGSLGANVAGECEVGEISKSSRVFLGPASLIGDSGSWKSPICSKRVRV